MEKISCDNPNTPDGEYFSKEDFGDKIYICKNDDGRVITNVPHYWDFHAPSHRFNFNCACRGALNLALNILLHVGFDKQAAFGLHNPFAKEFLFESMPVNYRLLKKERILEWGNHQIKALKIQTQKEFHL